MGNVSDWIARRASRDSIEDSFTSDNIGWFPVKEFDAKGDGSTDDTEAIQDAFDAAGEYGGVVYFAKSTGAYIITDTIDVPANVYVLGHGAEVKTTQAKTMFYMDSDTLGSTTANVVFDSLKITGEQYAAASNSSAIEIYGSSSPITNITIKNCEFNTFGTYVIELLGTKDVIIENCYIYNCYDCAIYTAYSNYNIVVTGNIIKSALALYFTKLNNSIISNNTMTDMDYGIYLDELSNLNVQICNNTIKSKHTDTQLKAGSGNTGIFIYGGNNISVSNNVVENHEYGIEVNGNETIGLSINNNILKNCYKAGMYFGVPVTGISITNNTIIDPWYDLSTAYGIYIDSVGTNDQKGIISGNIFTKDDSTETYVLTYAIYIAETTGISLIIGDNYSEATTYFYDASTGLTET